MVYLKTGIKPINHQTRPVMPLQTSWIRKLSYFASALLFTIGLFHGSGLQYVNGLVAASDATQLIKDIFPVLFIAPSLQLIGLALIGVLAVRKPINSTILGVVSILVLINAAFAFWLNAIIPGVVLFLPGIILMFCAWSSLIGKGAPAPVSKP